MKWKIGAAHALMLCLFTGWPLPCGAQGFGATLSKDAGILQERFELLDIDTLFYIDNDGLERILANLNGHFFKLASDPEEVGRSSNAFLIPEFGETTINIARFIKPGEENFIELRSQGPPGSSAFILIGDLLVPGQEIDFSLQELTPFPDRVALPVSYPNPFHDHATITYEIPLDFVQGVEVQLAIYDVAGRQVSVLVDGLRFPGRFEVRWRPEANLADGVYFCRLLVAGTQRTTGLVRVKR